MQLEFDLAIETVKKKTKIQKEEDFRYSYSEKLFYGNLERLSETWNVPCDSDGLALTD